MENWGLITYRFFKRNLFDTLTITFISFFGNPRETALLYDDKKSSVSNKERVCEVIAHELAHQWFGNLVTMDWYIRYLYFCLHTITIVFP